MGELVPDIRDGLIKLDDRQDLCIDGRGVWDRAHGAITVREACVSQVMARAGRSVSHPMATAAERSMMLCARTMAAPRRAVAIKDLVKESIAA